MAPGLPKLLLDQGLPRDAAELLRSSGVDCTHVSEIGYFAAEDSEILEWARLNNCAVVTLDADFHAILVLRNSGAPSVIRIRVQGLNGPAVAAMLVPIIATYAAELSAGCMITVKQRKITCHLLTR